MARVRHPYRDAIENELAYARELLPEIDADRFRFELGLLKLVDAADFYLNLFRTHRWFRRYVQVSGHWPSADLPALLLGSHWGAAHWIWRDLRHHGFHAWFVARPSRASDFGRGRLASWYGRFRGWGLRRAGASGVIVTGGALEKITAALDRGEAVVALNDIPAKLGQPGATVELLRRKVRLAEALPDLATQRNISITWFAMSLDLRTGHRRLCIERLDDGGDGDRPIAKYARHVSGQLETRPGSWQTWSLARELFAPDDRAESELLS